MATRERSGVGGGTSEMAMTTDEEVGAGPRGGGERAYVVGVSLATRHVMPLSPVRPDEPTHSPQSHNQA